MIDCKIWNESNDNMYFNIKVYKIGAKIIENQNKKDIFIKININMLRNFLSKLESMSDCALKREAWVPELLRVGELCFGEWLALWFKDKLLNPSNTWT